MIQYNAAPFDASNGLHQRYTMAPLPFSLYFGKVVDDWRSKWSMVGVDMKYKHGCKLIGNRTAKTQLLSSIITESEFEDDAAL